MGVTFGALKQPGKVRQLGCPKTSGTSSARILFPKRSPCPQVTRCGFPRPRPRLRPHITVRAGLTGIGRSARHRMAESFDSEFSITLKTTRADVPARAHSLSAQERAEAAARDTADAAGHAHHLAAGHSSDRLHAHAGPLRPRKRTWPNTKSH